jgi:hypothetical protein
MSKPTPPPSGFATPTLQLTTANTPHQALCASNLLNKEVEEEAELDDAAQEQALQDCPSLGALHGASDVDVLPSSGGCP